MLDQKSNAWNIRVFYLQPRGPFTGSGIICLPVNRQQGPDGVNTAVHVQDASRAVLQQTELSHPVYTIQPVAKPV